MAVGQQNQIGFKNTLVPVLVAGNTIRIDKNGLFIYNGPVAKGNLVAAAVPSATFDTVGDSVQPVLTAGKWSAVTGLPIGTSNVDTNGDLSVNGPDNVTRLQIYTGAGIRNPGSVYWFNDFGAVVQVIDPVVKGSFQYTDNGNAVQGGTIGAEVWSLTAVNDPVNNTSFNPGFTNFDPIAAGLSESQPGIVSVGNAAGHSFLGRMVGLVGSGATRPMLALAAPQDFNHGADPHAVIGVEGESPDGTHQSQIVMGSVVGNNNPVPTTTRFLEVQGTSIISAAPPGSTFVLEVDCTNSGVGGGSAVFMTGATDFAFGVYIIGDSAGDPRFLVRANGEVDWGPGGVSPVDTNLHRVSAGRLKTDGNFEVGTNLVVDNILELTNIAVPAALSGITEIVGTTTDLAASVGANGTQGFLQATQSSVTAHTVVAAVQTALSDTWTIPANSAVAKDIYEIEAFGNGIQGSTAQALTLGIFLNGANFITFTLPAADIAASAVFRWTAKMRFAIITAGAGGTCFGEIEGKWTTANVDSRVGNWMNLPATAINTTVANTLAITATWGATTGAPTLTCVANYFKKVA